jgi:uncharacterized membrane protein YczE
MLAVARRGPRIAFARTGTELAALGLGYALGGAAGIGTLLFAAGIGPCMEGGFWLLARCGLTQPPRVPTGTSAASPAMSST